jgi:hypothetical protein
MQLYKPFIASSQINTILGGFGGSWFFILSLTVISTFHQILSEQFKTKNFQAISNLESCVLGKGFQAKVFPEVAICLLSALIVCGMIHRVCVTTCILFSALGLYYLNSISQKFHAVPERIEVPTKKRKNK